MNGTRVLRALVTTAAAAGLAVGFSGSAHAQSGYTDGVVMSQTLVTHENCRAVVQAGTSNSNHEVYARGLFTLFTSSHGGQCSAWMERSVNNGPWKRISGVHSGSGGTEVTTYYYYDWGNYRARVCAGDETSACGAAW